MGVVWTPDSGYAKERVNWEATHTEFGAPKRPYEYRPFPTQMYKAWRNPANGKIEIQESQRAEDDVMQRNLESRGFVWGGPEAAIDAWKAREFVDATAAAERNYEVAHGKHSERAQAEIAAAESAAGAKHLAEIPETPIPAHRKRAYRKRTPKPQTTEAETTT